MRIALALAAWYAIGWLWLHVRRLSRLVRDLEAGERATTRLLARLLHTARGDELGVLDR